MKAYAGKTIRRAVKKYTGFGAYTPVAGRGMTGHAAPKINNGALDEGAIVISHEEYLGEVLSSSNQNVMATASFKINPGNVLCFPFLSQIARSFQEYRLEGMAFHFRTMYAEATTGSTNAAGSVIMSTQYDPTDSAPTSKQEMVNTEYAQTSKPSQSMTHFIECGKSSSPLSNLYIAQQPESQKGDERFYNFGTFTIATLGIPETGATLGELWVSYQVRLFKPKIDINDAAKDRYFYWGINGTNVCTNALPLGNIDMSKEENQALYMYKASNYLPVKLAGSYIYFPGTRTPKSYIVKLHWFGANANINPGGANYDNCGFDTLLFPQTNAAGTVTPGNIILAPPSGSNSAAMSLTYGVSQKLPAHLNGQPWGIELTGMTLPATCSGFRMYVTEIPVVTNTNIN